MIEVRYKVNDFQLRGDVNYTGPLAMVSFFSWPRYFYGPTRDLKKAKASVQRMKALGFHGGRIFDETHEHHQGHHVFWKPISTAPYDLNQPVSSAFALMPQQLRAYEEMNRILVDEKFIVERVINATIKQSPTGIESVRRTVGFWERMQRTVMRHMFEEGFENQFYENTNEFEAHTRTSVMDFLRTDWNGVDLVARMALRAKEDHPEVPYGMSHGGRWFPIDYPVAGSGDPYPRGGNPTPQRYHPNLFERYGHVNIHTPRSGPWWEIDRQLGRLQDSFPDVPRYLNENMFVMTTQQRDEWRAKGYNPISRGSARAASSRLDVHAEQLFSQFRQAWGHRVSYCLHNMNGVLATPDAPPDPFEELISEHLGGSNPPPPVEDEDERVFVGRMYRTLLNRNPDFAGWNHHTSELFNEHKRLLRGEVPPDIVQQRLEGILPELELLVRMSKGDESARKLERGE